MAVTLFATNRQPGQSTTGSFAQSQQQQIEETLAQAATDENQGQAGQAAQLYQSVLDKHPDNEVALAQLGWLEYQTGVHGNSAPLIADARAKLCRAVRLDPGDYAARLYLGTVLLQRDGNSGGSGGPVPAVPGRRPSGGAGDAGRAGDPGRLRGGGSTGPPGAVGRLSRKTQLRSYPTAGWQGRATSNWSAGARPGPGGPGQGNRHHAAPDGA